MPVRISLDIPCDHQSLAEAAQIIATLSALYPDRRPPDDDEQPAGVPAGPDIPPQPLTAAAGNPEDFVEQWLAHLGEGSRRFWRIAASYARDNPGLPIITFEDLERASGLSKETLRSYHRNSYRAINDEKAPDPMPGAWSAATKRTEYSMTRAVREKILELTENDPE